MGVTAIVVVTAILAIGLIVWFFRGQNPAQGEGDASTPADTPSERFYSKFDRPAGPDAEAMGTGDEPIATGE